MSHNKDLKLKIEDVLIQVADHIMDGVTIADMKQPDAPLVYVNDGFCSFTGYSKNEIMGKNCRFLQGEATDKQVVQKISEAILSRAKGIFELRNYHKNGSIIFNRLSLTPIFDETGDLSYYLGIQSDITNTVEAETEFYDHKSEMSKALGLVQNEINQTLDHLKLEKSDTEMLKNDLKKIKKYIMLLRTINETESREILDLVKF